MQQVREPPTARAGPRVRLEGKIRECEMMQRTSFLLIAILLTWPAMADENKPTSTCDNSPAGKVVINKRTYFPPSEWTSDDDKATLECIKRRYLVEDKSDDAAVAYAEDAGIRPTAVYGTLISPDIKASDFHDCLHHKPPFGQEFFVAKDPPWNVWHFSADEGMEQLRCIKRNLQPEVRKRATPDDYLNIANAFDILPASVFRKIGKRPW